MEWGGGEGLDGAGGVADDACGIRLHCGRYRHPQTQGKVERFHGALEMARRRRGLPALEQRQSWLDEFR